MTDFLNNVNHINLFALLFDYLTLSLLVTSFAD